MKKENKLEAKIKELEERIKLLEARPHISFQQYPIQPQQPNPQWPPSPWCNGTQPPFINYYLS